MQYETNETRVPHNMQNDASVTRMPHRMQNETNETRVPHKMQNDTSVTRMPHEMQNFENWTYTLREAGLYSKQCNVLTSTRCKIAREDACKMQVRCTKQCDAVRKIARVILKCTRQCN